jgi:integrase/recombinase XerD
MQILRQKRRQIPLTHVERTLNKLAKQVSDENKKIILDFLRYMENMKEEITDRTKSNNIKNVIYLARFLGKISLKNISAKKLEEFVNSKRKDVSVDPDRKSLSTYNDYVIRLRFFYRWLYNKNKRSESRKEWVNPNVIKNIKTRSTKNKKKTYSKGNIWILNELQSIIKYEPHLRNKALILLSYDSNSRPHELTKLRIENIRFMDKYAEGEIPFDTKTGRRDILLRGSFPYCRDWLNQHPHRNNPNAYFFYDLRDSTKPMTYASIYYTFRTFKERIQQYYNDGIISDPEERKKIEEFLTYRKFNPYCIRTSAIREDAETLSTSNLETKVGWKRGSKMPRVYLDDSMSAAFKKQLLTRDGLKIDEEGVKAAVIECHYCNRVNAIDAMVCQCGAILSQEELNRRKEEDRKKEMVNEQKIKYLLKKDVYRDFESVIDKMLSERRVYGNISPTKQLEYFMESRKAKVMSDEELGILKTMVDEGEIKSIEITHDEDDEILQVKYPSKYELKDIEKLISDPKYEIDEETRKEVLRSLMVKGKNNK